MTPPVPTPSPAPASRSRTAILTVLFAGALLSGAHLVRRGLAASDTAPPDGSLLFDDVRLHLSRLYVDSISDSSMYHMAVDGLMQELNDPGNAFIAANQHAPPPKSGASKAVQQVRLLPNAIGYIDVNTFNNTLAPDVAHAVDSLVRGGARALIVDMRADSTDSLDASVQLAGLFLNPGQEVMHTRGRVPTANHTYVNQRVQQWPALLLAVLVDRRSANSAELVAGALQDHDRAVIVGAQTAGEGGSQTLYPVDDAGTLKLTTARWLTPSGRTIATLPPDPSADPDKPEDKPKFQTDDGRTIVGGGGIIPDVIVGDTTAHRKIRVSKVVVPQPSVTQDTILAMAEHLLTGSRSQSEVLHRATQLAGRQKLSP